jgi:hypothetical protein
MNWRVKLEKRGKVLNRKAAVKKAAAAGSKDKS